MPVHANIQCQSVALSLADLAMLASFFGCRGHFSCIDTMPFDLNGTELVLLNFIIIHTPSKMLLGYYWLCSIFRHSAHRISIKSGPLFTGSKQKWSLNSSSSTILGILLFSLLLFRVVIRNPCDTHYVPSIFTMHFFVDILCMTFIWMCSRNGFVRFRAWSNKYVQIFHLVTPSPLPFASSPLPSMHGKLPKVSFIEKFSKHNTTNFKYKKKDTASWDWERANVACI